MNKAKALFTAGVMVVVAGASAVCWQLNESGVFEPEKQTDGENIGYADTVDKDGNDEYIKDVNDGGEIEADEKNPIAAESENDAGGNKSDENEDNEDTEEDYGEINSFLSVLASLYFSESKPYKSSSAQDYELVRFAYLYNTVYDGGSNVTVFKDDEIGAYNGVSVDKVNEICKKFFNKTVDCSDIYTEKTYAFFIYEDGYFYTPAAEGVGYNNKAFVDSAEKNGDTVTVAFTVYSDGVDENMTSREAAENGIKYGQGTAKLVLKDNSFIIEAYSLVLG